MTDFHCHCLPCTDDGASDIDTAVKMITALHRQGVTKIAATPHYYPNLESIDDFVKRRDASLKLLNEKFIPIPILAGAEVLITQQLSTRECLGKLLIDSRPYILLELPDMPYNSWMSEEICNVAYGINATPIIAHLDRYFDIYTKLEINEILSIPSAVFQINADALLSLKSSKFVLKLIKYGYPIIFGSDAHDMELRPPRFSEAIEFLKKKLKKTEFALFLSNISDFITAFDLSASEPSPKTLVTTPQ